MACIIETTTIGISRNEAGELTALRYFTPAPLFGPKIPEAIDATIIDDNGPWWLGHTVNLDIDGEEIVLNCQVQRASEAGVNAPSAKEIEAFIKRHGVIEVCEQIVNPDTLSYEPRTHTISASYYKNHVEFVMNYHYGTGDKVQ
ncbi:MULTISPECIES: hypothetical protein [Marinobacter]|uniref:Uncharacterized protein n=1 Tax=Marinobacter nauticus (strain ATCC 700491 / DSM 11845 / VT8) TaxID=351348 RepID=A1U7Y6_MARN8|nr:MULTISPECIES: hypothetical protein [Marinobacter]ABM21105.1 hypothetical protein Maqu_4254 [Marinobacter nauticus VT8]|tara:strand:- start:1808 stop:2239 length:432 start_codon:yes stop_codon:yes gene_type:complete